jgi:hypothetical protein
MPFIKRKRRAEASLAAAEAAVADKKAEVDALKQSSESNRVIVPPRPRPAPPPS